METKISEGLRIVLSHPIHLIILLQYQNRSADQRRNNSCRTCGDSGVELLLAGGEWRSSSYPPSSVPSLPTYVRCSPPRNVVSAHSFSSLASSWPIRLGSSHKAGHWRIAAGKWKSGGLLCVKSNRLLRINSTAVRCWGVVMEMNH